MTDEETQNLNELLESFGAAVLGEGDLVAGVNLLAAMACSIANLQRPGSGCVDSAGNCFLVGGSLIISGSHSAELIRENVIRPMAVKQANLVSHILESAQEIEEAKRKQSGASKSRDPFLAAVDHRLTMNNLFSGEMAGCYQSLDMAVLLESEATRGLGTLAQNSHVFIAAHSPSQVLRMLPHSQLNRPMVYISVDDARGLQAYRNVCSDIIDGRGMASIQGSVLITDPCSVLSEVVRSEESGAALAQRMMWLVDGDAGPCPGDVLGSSPRAPIDRLRGRYDRVMGQTWGERITPRRTSPAVIEFEFAPFQAKWMSFLKGHEARHPGVCGTARGLFLTLLFGFDRLIKAWKPPSDFPAPKCEGILALSKFLVLRMINCRSAMLVSAQDVWMGRTKARILRKLRDASWSQRDIYRHLNLAAGECDEALRALELDGRVTREGSLWSATGLEGVPAPQSLTLEV
jgi:hypothetical protein